MRRFDKAADRTGSARRTGAPVERHDTGPLERGCGCGWVDKPVVLIDDPGMADLSTSSRRRVLLADQGDADRHLRVTWHQDEHVVVFSQWSGSVCSAAIPVSVAETASLATLLVDALGQELRSLAVAQPPTVIPARRSWPLRLLDRFRISPAPTPADAIPLSRERAS